mmetsp:Transcript_22699/g.32027  ORF Transcript_22699/g.32027 Transcript_22699/m.32027 type:complete len:396 (-) Transcript_22699:572-1759(-)
MVCIWVSSLWFLVALGTPISCNCDIYNSTTTGVRKAQISSRIYGGDAVPSGTYPWFCRAMIGSNWAQCGGTLLSPSYILTAAHCLAGRSVTKFEVGALCTNQKFNCGQKEVVVDVKKSILHPHFNGIVLSNDFALVRLKQKVTGITPAHFDTDAVVDSYSKNTRNLWAVGFGKQQDSSLPQRLQHVELGFVKRKLCNRKYKKKLGKINSIKKNMICAALPGKDACQGDSGGPLYDASSQVLIGVTSWGAACADPDSPGVYALVADARNWIRRIICHNHSNPKPSFCSDPPLPCGSEEKRATVEIKTDENPYDTTWLIKDLDGNVHAESDKYDTKYHVYRKKVCLHLNTAYKFIIKDEFKDGLSGGTGGYFKIYWRGNVYTGDPDFGSKNTLMFGN